MQEKQFDGLNMVPFIDIMLVLLTIVLTTSTFIASGRIPVHLPQAASHDKEVRTPQTLEIDAQGGLHYAGKPVTLTELPARLAGVDRQTPVMLRADKAMVLQHLVSVMDALQTLGFTRVALQTQVGA
jgi:biopolymer transport protein ExbD